MSRDAEIGEAGRAQRIAGHDRGHRDPGRPDRRCGARPHRRRHPDSDPDSHPHGCRGPSVFGAVPQPTGNSALPRAHQAYRQRRATPGPARTRSGMHEARVHRSGLSEPGSPRRTRLATRRQHQYRCTHPGLRMRQPPGRRYGDRMDHPKRKGDNRTEWIPPRHLDRGQNRINEYHHPERVLRPDADEPG